MSGDNRVVIECVVYDIAIQDGEVTRETMLDGAQVCSVQAVQAIVPGT